MHVSTYIGHTLNSFNTRLNELRFVLLRFKQESGVLQYKKKLASVSSSNGETRHTPDSIIQKLVCSNNLRKHVHNSEGKNRS